MRKADNKIMAAVEGLAVAARQHQGDSMLLLNTLMAASTIAEGIAGEDARRLEQMIDACIMATERTLDHLSINRNELHETASDLGTLLQARMALLSEKDSTHDHRQ
ncbi:TPA: hypothetical protein ACNUVO_003323 [Aeromonas salmonicida subsp. pectinolytica]